MRLEGTQGIRFHRLGQQWAINFDRRQRIMDSMMWYLGEHIRAERPGRAIWNALRIDEEGNFTFHGEELLDESFSESDELIEGLWDVKEDIEKQIGYDTRLVDDWTVEFRAA